MKIYQLYNANDPDATDKLRLPFAYLHGKLEEINIQKQEMEGWKANYASDIFLIDDVMHSPGTYLGQFYDRFALIVIDSEMEGRIALLDDIQGLSHIINPDNWR